MTHFWHGENDVVTFCYKWQRAAPAINPDADDSRPDPLITGVWTNGVWRKRPLGRVGS